MKKILLTTLLVAAVAPAFAQGFLTWGNNPVGFRAPIYGPEPASITTSLSGASALGTPAGTTVYTGPLLNGANYAFEVWVGPLSAVDSTALTLFASTTFRTSTGVGLPAGLVNGATAQVAGITPGNAAKFQIRAWDTTSGASYDLASIHGATGLITSQPLGGIDAGGNIVPTPATTGWSSFNIYVVPEPSTFVLAGLGAASLLIFRRRK